MSKNYRFLISIHQAESQYCWDHISIVDTYVWLYARWWNFATSVVSFILLNLQDLMGEEKGVDINIFYI